MKLRRIIAVGLSWMLLWNALCHSVLAAEEPSEISSNAYVLMEAETGTVLLAQNGEKRISCGVMAKLMTAFLVGEQLVTNAWEPETVLTTPDAVNGLNGAMIWLMPGETMTVDDLLKGLIVGNAGDAAVTFAWHISGDVDTFVMEMNARAFDLGMRSTRFDSPQGSEENTQYTTAYDLALLCRALAEQEILTPYFTIWRDFLRGEDTELVNENTFARTDETSMGWKACHSEQSGWSVAAGAERNHMQCIAVVMGCEIEEDRFALAKDLLRRGFLGWKVLLPGFSAEFLYPVQVRSGVERAVLVEPDALKGLVVPRNCNELETVLVLPQYVEAPVRRGQKLGTVAFYEGDTLLYETNVVASDNVEKRQFQHTLLKIVVKMMKI